LRQKTKLVPKTYLQMQGLANIQLFINRFKKEKESNGENYFLNQTCL
jgi:hypothetical protein